MKRRIAVIGLGTFGQEVSRQLVTLGCEVIAIDRDPEGVRDLADVVTRAAVADVLDRDALRALGVDECDCAVLALRGHIDTSVLAVLVLQELGVREIVAQAVSEDHRRALQRLGASRVVFPEMDMAERAAQIITAPDLLDYVNLAPGYGLSEIEVPTPFIDKTIIQANVRQEYGINIAAIRNRLDAAAPATPDGTAKAAGALGKYGSSAPPNTPPAAPSSFASSGRPSSRTHGLPFVPPPNYTFRQGDLLLCMGRTEDLRRLADL